MTKKMNPEIKVRWVAALRSGEYKQTSGSLRDRTGFCCLGVLCDLKDPNAWDRGNYCGESGTLAPAVAIWAGLPSHLGEKVRIGARDYFLSEHNDAGRTFAEIADAIEQQL